MSNIVEYILNLKDNLSPALSGATSHAQHLESTLGSVKSMAAGIGTALGIAFGAYQIVNFAKEGYEAFHLLEQETAKVEANLDATSGKAGMAISDISGFAKELSSKIQASRVDIMDMSSQLLTFPAITKDVFQSSMGLVADIAKQTNHGLSETAIMYGKALSNPAEGLQKMQRYGVILTDQEKEKIKALQASGNLIGAQKQMMDDIAHSGYAGVAEKMFNADPVAHFNKMMDDAKLEVGEYLMEIVKKLIPAMEWLVGVLKDTVKFIKEYSSALTLIIGIYATYKGIMLGIIALEKLSVYWKGISTTASELLLGWDMARATGLGVLTSAQWALNLAMDANPIGLIVLGIAALIALIYELVSWIISLSNHFGGFGKMLIGVWDIIKAFGKGVGLVFFGLTEIILGFLRAPFDGAKLLKQGLKDTVNAVKDAGKEIDAAWNKDAQEAAKEGIKKKSNIPAKVGATGKPGGDGTNAPTPKTKAEGQKTINIHVAYNAPLMSGGITISTTNLHEGAGKIKEILTEMLVGATHDTLMVADY